jgi:DNA-binding NarL/FixJ family response regulator
MTNENATTMDAVLELAERWARRRFAADPDAESKVADAVSVAWEFFAKYGDRAVAGQIASFAIKRVRSGRQFQRSRTSGNQVERQVTRSDFDVNEIGSVSADPARLASFRVDFSAWLETLTPDRQKIVEWLGMGEMTKDVARLYGCTPGRISQYRNELAKSYHEFIAE